MAVKNLQKEASYMCFVEQVADNAFPVVDDHILYYEKSLFLRMCAGQTNLRKAFYAGHDERLLNVSWHGPQRFFVELIAIELFIPLFAAAVLLKLKFCANLIKSLSPKNGGRSLDELYQTKDLMFLTSDFSRLTDRFLKVIANHSNVCEVHSDSSIKLLNGGTDEHYSLPQLSISQFIKVLKSQSWKMTYLMRVYRQFNFISKYGFKTIYVMDGDAPMHVSSAHAAFLATIKSIGVQWGCMPIGVKPGYKLFPFDEFYCTGKYYVDLLKGFSKKTNFFCKGYRVPNAEMLINNVARKKSILFLLSDSKTIVNGYEIKLLIDICIETKEKFPNLSISVRPHPDMFLDEDTISKFKINDISVDRSLSPDDALINNKFIVGQLSSLMIESIEYDCIPVFMDIGIKKMFPDLMRESAAMMFKTKENWFEMLNDLLVNYSGYQTDLMLKKTLNNNPDSYNKRTGVSRA